MWGLHDETLMRRANLIILVELTAPNYLHSLIDPRNVAQLGVGPPDRRHWACADIGAVIAIDHVHCNASQRP